MLTLPIPLLISWLIGLFSLAVLAGGISLLYHAGRRWIRHDRRRRSARSDREVLTEDRAVHHRATLAEGLKNAAILTPLIAGAVLLVLSFAGGHLIRFAFPAGNDEPMTMRTGTGQDLTRPDGTRIHAELYGPADGPVLVFTHGWGRAALSGITLNGTCQIGFASFFGICLGWVNRLSRRTETSRWTKWLPTFTP
jgi:hypothetical protein